MDSQPHAEAPPERPFNWTWALIVAVWLLLFMIVLAAGAAVVFWRQAASAKYAVAAITAEYQTLNDQLTASDAQVATLTKDRSTLVDQLAATNKQLAAAGNQLATPNAAVAKLTSERNTLTEQLANANAALAKLATERDTLTQQLTAAQTRLLTGAQNPAPVPVPAANLPPAPAAPLAGLSISDRLTLEYTSLLANDPNAASLQEAARLFDQPSRKGRSNYQPALQLILEHRSKTAIPLLLCMAIKDPAPAAAGRGGRQPFDSSKPLTDAVTLLTGEEPSLSAPLEWWIQNKHTLNTDLNKMTPDQLHRVEEILYHMAYERRGAMRPAVSAGDMNSLLHMIFLSADSRSPGILSAADFCPAMLPDFLQRAGWSKEGKPFDTLHDSFPLETIPLLAALRKSGQARDLDKITTDVHQSTITRLTCLLALRAAGESINGDLLVAIATQEKNLPIRIVAALAMQYAPSHNVAAKLIELLGDPSEDIVAAAAMGIEANPTPDAVPALKRVLDKFTPHNSVWPALNALGKIKTNAAADALASFLFALSKSANPDEYLYPAMDSFCQITNYPRKAGTLKAEDAASAYAWWQKNKNPNAP